MIVAMTIMMTTGMLIAAFSVAELLPVLGLGSKASQLEKLAPLMNLKPGAVELTE